MSDPFSMVHDELWNLLEDSSVVTSMFKIGNRLKLNSPKAFNPLKDEISQADLPELVMALGPGLGNLLATSSTSFIQKTYQLLIATGNFQITQKIAPAEFAIFAALANWPNILPELRWPLESSPSFVKKINISTIDGGLEDAERNRGVAGWSAIWQITVDMHFKTSDLVAYSTGSGS